MLVAQTAKQKAVEVEAEVTPNPNATLLTTNAGGQQVTLNAEAGVATTFTCPYMVKVQTTQVNWQLKDGLYSDFSNGTSTWPGGDLKHSYVRHVTRADANAVHRVFNKRRRMVGRQRHL